MQTAGASIKVKQEFNCPWCKLSQPAKFKLLIIHSLLHV